MDGSVPLFSSVMMVGSPEVMGDEPINSGRLLLSALTRLSMTNVQRGSLNAGNYRTMPLLNEISFFADAPFTTGIGRVGADGVAISDNSCLKA